ncbi:hypothetical protein [Pseudactinotalea suaedae]|uniref:hypothetical protein n=1 Tax=Pseudactinotalea suaedae TaxID=1524924 RepID=UPI0012E2D1D5|nr:hypothetical protein [Pseudactinotalea suaedae]
MTEPQPPAAPYGAVDPDPTPPHAQAAPPGAGEPPSSAPPGPPSGLANERGPRRRVASTAAVLALVGSLAGWGWFASENAREGWWEFGRHVAVEPGDDGWADVDTLSVRLTAADTATTIDGVEPPAGFEYLVLAFDVEATEVELYRSCTVEVLDTQGREFLAGREVPNGDPYTSELMCGTSDPEEDPVPGAQSVLVLVPTGAEPVSVRIDSREFPPATFVELPLRS